MQEVLRLLESSDKSADKAEHSREYEDQAALRLVLLGPLTKRHKDRDDNAQKLLRDLDKSDDEAEHGSKDEDRPAHHFVHPRGPLPIPWLRSGRCKPPAGSSGN